MRNSFSKEFHLLKAIDFDYLKKGSRVINSRYFRFYYKKSRLVNNEHARLGISVSKKVAKAHDRNLIKRFIREAFRVSSIKSHPIDILVVASPRIDMKSVDQKQLRNSVISSLNETKKWKLEK
jgi:ribonuclease P protein component